MVIDIMKDKAVVSKDILDLVSVLPGLNYGYSDDEKKHLDAIAILSLPSHLRKTAVAIHKRQKVSVEMLSNITEQSVDVEQANLQELVDMKYLGCIQDEAGTFYYIY